MCQSLLQSIRNAFHSEDFLQIVAMSKEESTKCHHSPDCMLLQAQSHQLLGKISTAREYYLDVLIRIEQERDDTANSHPLRFTALMGLIRCNRLLQETEKALALLDQVAERFTEPQYQEKIVQERIWCQRITNPEKALHLWISQQRRPAVETTGRTVDPDALLLHVQLLYDAGSHEKTLQLADDLKPDSINPAVTRARILQVLSQSARQKGQFQNVTRWLKSAARIYERYRMYQRLIEVRAETARAYSEQGRTEQAVDLLRRTRDQAYRLDLPVDPVLKVAEQNRIPLNRSEPPRFSLIDHRREVPGQTRQIRQINEQIRRAAHLSHPVLILGETGAGKEVTAQAIHQASPLAQKPFVTIHCPGLTENLFESTLFGHRRGSFTGASDNRTGLVPMAADGFLFFDEISEISPTLQAKLLRFLDTREYRVLGSQDNRRSPARIIAASNRNYGSLLNDKSFRSDLLHRISGSIITLPPLRQRKDDIPLLLGIWLEELNHEFGLKKIIARDTFTFLERYEFPGNVRELKFLFQEAWGNANSRIKPDHFNLERMTMMQPGTQEASASVQPLKQSLLQFEKRLIQQTLDQVNFDKTQASRLLAISRQTLYNKIRELGIRRQES